MRQFLVFLMILIIVLTLMENLKHKIRYEIEPVESFEKEKFLWRTHIHGRAALDPQPIDRQGS